MHGQLLIDHRQQVVVGQLIEEIVGVYRTGVLANTMALRTARSTMSVYSSWRPARAPVWVGPTVCPVAGYCFKSVAWRIFRQAAAA
jgi:hypothetical protein